jgi:hypothetical protein
MRNRFRNHSGFHDRFDFGRGGKILIRGRRIEAILRDMNVKMLITKAYELASAAERC